MAQIHALRRLGAIVSAGALVFAACGDDDDLGDFGDLSSEDAGDIQDALDDIDPSDVNDFDDAVNAAESAGIISGDCADAVSAYLSALGNMSSGFAALGGGAPGDVDYEAFTAGVQALADQAPSELEDEFEVWSQTLTQFFAGLSEIEFTPGQAPDQATIEQFEVLGEVIDTEEFNAANDAIGDWFDENCNEQG